MSEDTKKPVDPDRAARDAARAERMAARKAAQAAAEKSDAASAETNQPIAQPESGAAGEAQTELVASATPGDSTTHTEAAPGQETASAEEPAKAVNADRAARDAARAERAAARAAAKAAAEGGAAPAPAAEAPAGETAAVDPDRAAREAARAERAAARAAAKTAEGGEGGAEAAPKAPSPNQPKLDRLVAIVKENVGETAITEAFINERDRHLPVVVVDKNHWSKTAELLRDHEELKLHYLRNVTGVDYESHMEVDYYLLNLRDKQNYCVKVRTDREAAEMPSATPVWSTANWNEREIYDLLGITFTGHPNLTRIMMPDDWIGHPLRKDYEPIDPEV